MKKMKSLKLFAAVLFAAAIVLAGLYSVFAETENDVYISADMNPQSGETYLIGDADDLILFSSLVNRGMLTEGVTFVLTKDILFNPGSFDEDGKWSESGSPAEFVPIGTKEYPFRGIFTGANHTISGVYINSDKGYAGLFGFIIGASIGDFALDNSYISGGYFVGGIVGYAVSTGETVISNCHVKAYIRCDSGTGGAIAGSALGAGGSINISGNSSESNLPMIGYKNNGVVMVQNNEIITDAQAGDVFDGEAARILVVAVVIVTVSIAVLFIVVSRRKKANVSDCKAPDEAEDDKLSDESDEVQEEACDIAGAEDAVGGRGEIVSDAARGEEDDGEGGTDTDADKVDDGTEVIAAVAVEQDRTPPAGYYYIKHTSDGGFMFNLKAGNHEIIATSEVYSTLAACKKGIASVTRSAPEAGEEIVGEDGVSVPAPKFEIYNDKKGKFRFRLKAGNYEIIAVSQAYITLVGCRRGIESVRRNSVSSKIIIEDNETQKKCEALRAEINKASKVTAEEADGMIEDSVAELLLEFPESDVPAKNDNKKVQPYDVFIDTISENFDNGDTVDAAALIRKGLVPEGTKKIRIAARGILDKQLNVVADDFTLEVVKMIVLVGGHAVKK